MEPDTRKRIDGIAKDHDTVLVKITPPLRLFHKLLNSLSVLERFRNQVVGEHIGVLGNNTHEIPGVVVAGTPAMCIFSRFYIMFHIQNELGRIEMERVAIGIIEESVVGLVNLIGLVDLVLPFLLDCSGMWQSAM